MSGTRPWKEAAKFASGVATWEAVVHASLLANGQTVVLWGIRLTPTLNLVQTILPAIVALGLAWFGWRRPDPTRTAEGD